MNPVKKVFQFGWIAALGILILVGCSGGSNRDAKTAASALINTNKNIVAFGHISVEQILNKLDYQHLPKVNAIVGSELKSWQNGLDLSKPMYFAMQAPFAKDGSPEITYALLDVKNKDSLVSKFSGMGYATEKTGDIDCFREGDVAVGIRNKLAIVLIKGGEYDFKAALATAFDETEGDESTGKTAKILGTSGDVVSGLSIERLYASSNTSLNKLDAAKKKELDGLVADGFVQTVMNFEKGQLTVKASNLFSEQLKDRLFFKEDASASVLKKLGTGNAWMGVAANLDVRKMESFMREFAPEAEQKMNDILPGEASIVFAMVGESPLGKLFSGEFGLVMTGDPKNTMGMLPQFNFFLGLGSKGDFINTKMSDYAGMMQLKKEGDAFVTEGMAIAPRQDGIYGYTVPANASGKLKIPGFAQSVFGKKTFSLFIDFSQIDVKSLELHDGYEVLEIMDSFLVSVDRNGGELILTSKDKSSNILKQMGLFYTNMMEERMGGMTM